MLGNTTFRFWRKELSESHGSQSLLRLLIADYDRLIFERLKLRVTGLSRCQHLVSEVGPETAGQTLKGFRRIGVALPHKACQRQGSIYLNRSHLKNTQVDRVGGQQ